MYAYITVVTTDGRRSICDLRTDNSSDLKRHTITTSDGFECDVIGNDQNCVEELKRMGVVIGNCGLYTSSQSECLVNRSLITNECCHQQEQKDCSMSKFSFQYRFIHYTLVRIGTIYT